MPSFISSSDVKVMPRWWWTTTWLLAFVIAAACVGTAEWLWRDRGYTPQIRDSAALWSTQRERVYATKKIPLVLIGASHIEFGIDMKRMKQLLPAYQPVMLAYNGHYPLATLHDLAEDEHFHGIVLCDIDARGLSGNYRDAQQNYVDYYHRQWSPSWWAHRMLLTDWQRAMVVAGPEFGAAAQVKRLLGSPVLPQRSPATMFPDRSGAIDFTKTDAPAFKRHFIDGFKSELLKHPPEKIDAWLADLKPVAAWIAAIRKRGGDVVFVRTPTTGELHALEEQVYPRSVYWDRLAGAVDAATIYSDGIPEWNALALPDGSHVDVYDKAVYTSALVDALSERGLLKR